MAHLKLGAPREGPWYMQLQPADTTTLGGLSQAPFANINVFSSEPGGALQGQCSVGGSQKWTPVSDARNRGGQAETSVQGRARGQCVHSVGTGNRADWVPDQKRGSFHPGSLGGARSGA